MSVTKRRDEARKKRRDAADLPNPDLYTAEERKKLTGRRKVSSGRMR